MDITQLKTLIHVAELGSLSKAADRLRIAQPALSRQIRLLESELGVQLFERHGRGMVITPVGQEVLAHASQVMAQLEAIRRLVAVDDVSFRGRVSMGLTPTVAEIVTVPLVRRIGEAHPDLAVRFSSAFSNHLLDWLQRGEIELAVAYDTQAMPSLRTVPVMMESLFLVGSEEGRFRLDRPVPLAAIADERMILPSPRHSLRQIIEDCAQKAGIQLTTVLEADSFGAIVDLVRAGFGSTVLPLAPVHNLIKLGILGAAPLTDPTPTRRLVLAYPADRPPTPAARYVGDAFRAVATDLIDQKVWAGELL